MAEIKAHSEVRMGPQGRLVIPAALRRALGFQPGDTLIARVEDNRLVIETREAILDRLQGMFRHVPREASMVDELIRERRDEARREDEEIEEFLRQRRETVSQEAEE